MPEPDEQEEPNEQGAETAADTDGPSDEEATEEEAHEADQEQQEQQEAAAPQGTTPEEWERRFQRVETAFRTYTKKVTEIYADEAPLLSPFAISPSAPPGFVYGPDAGRVPEEIQRATFEFFGLAREQDYEPDPETEMCRSCKGKCKTMTGATSGDYTTRPCPTCKGWGYTINGRAPSERATGTNGEVQNAPEAVGPLVTDEADNWGEPRVLPDGRVNPNYGKQPQFKEPVEPYGITANLTTQDAAA
jgi:hypothetical protein